MEKLNINGRLVGKGELPYIIAEVGSNHNGDMVLCKELISAAKDCGADAVKFQSWSKESLICRAEYARNTFYGDKHRHFGTLEEMVEKYQFTPEMHQEACEYCKEIDIHFLSSAFSPAEVDLLDSLGINCFKVASMDVNHLLLLEYIGSKGKPVILSTGMATFGEIETALKVLLESGSGPVSLLHCISIYPPDYESINLRNMYTFKQAFEVPVGFSDHTIGAAISLAAVALGACIIEKHFTLDKNMAGWDHWLSADAAELDFIVREGRNIFHALGSTTRKLSDLEIEKRKKFRRRIVIKRPVTKGKTLTENDLDYKRPGNGIHPYELPYVVGRKVRRDLDEDAELEWTDLE
jgi:N-acetylneuraminate synthase